MSDRDLTLAASRLARNAPTSWEVFMDVFRAYTQRAVEDCVRSPLEELQRNQGRAQATARLLAVFEGCLKSADQIERKENERR